MPATPTPPVHVLKAELFRALSNPVRVRLLELLVEGERPVSELLTATGLEPSHLSQHLGVLRRTGVATARRAGNSVHYRLTHPSVVDLLEAARTFLLGTLQDTLAVLDDLTEEDLTARSVDA